MRVTHSLLHADDLARLVEREYGVAAPLTVSLSARTSGSPVTGSAG